MNYRFDLDEWLPRCPLIQRYGHYSGQPITGPCDICQNEHLRRALRDQFDWGDPVPVDVFVMADGEPPDRHGTQVGGLPYRPASAPWPADRGGRPLQFVGQVGFADSRDITGPLPGDILLVFADLDEAEDSPFVEWQPLGLQDLTRPDQIPELEYDIAPCHGYVCRTASYPNARFLGGEDQEPTIDGMRVDQALLLLQYQATQIGRAPFFVQETDAEMPGTPLCVINSVQPDMHARWPWVNSEEPRMAEDELRYDDDYLMIGDAGCLYFSIDESGQILAGESFY